MKNQAGVALNGKWQLPDGGKTGTVANTNSAKYLSVNYATDPGSEVVEEALDTDDPGQQWQRSAEDSSGYFTLKNTKSGKFLTAVSADKLTIESMGLIENISPT